jgi:flagellar biosynthesis protein FliP
MKKPREALKNSSPGQEPGASSLNSQDSRVGRDNKPAITQRLPWFSRWLLVLILASPLVVLAQTGGLPALTSTPGPGGSQTYTLSIQTLITLTALTFIPAGLLMTTSFTRIIIVLSILRHALGTQTSPPNQVIIGLSLFLTFFIMSPVLEKVYVDAYLPLSENRITFVEAVDRGAVPLRTFMLKQTRETDIGLFARLGNTPQLASPDDIPMRVLIPAFVTSELKTAFQIGFIIFIPFLIIDMVVASVLMSMGMMMMSPVMISLPFKLMLFVLVDGWHLLLGSLVMSFAT